MKEIFEYVLPGQMLIWVFFIAQGAVSDVYGEARRRTLQRLLVSNVSFRQVLWAKMLRSFLLCLIAEFLLVLVSWLLMGVGWGNLFLLLLVLSAINLAMTGVLEFIYGLARNKNIADSISPAVILLLSILGGAMFPLEGLPPFMQALSHWTPTRWGVLSLQQVMRGEPLSEYGGQLILLVIAGLLGAGLGIGLFQRRFERGEMQ